MTLFPIPESGVPLAEQMRPGTLDRFIGQEDLLAPDGPIGRMLLAGRLQSMVLWGPPGCGKTSLARLLGSSFGAHWFEMSAVAAGVADVRRVVTESESLRTRDPDTQRVLFLDEVHRFNKAQQDALLPHIEKGLFVFIGATTENPSFEVNSALTSRAPVYLLRPLDSGQLGVLLERAVAKCALKLSKGAHEFLVEFADGDARKMLNLLEPLASEKNRESREINAEELERVALERFRRFDGGGDEFYDQISALHKSVRGSDPDASLYWLCRMFDGGADPAYIARRIIRMAAEDIGLADPRALQIALAAHEAYRIMGSPEGELALAQAALYAACAPKSNAVYAAFGRMTDKVSSGRSHPVPVHLRNAPTRLMKELGYGKEYRYAHDEPHGYVAGERYFPDDMEPYRAYEPTDRGLEKILSDRLAFFRKLDAEEKKGD